MEEKTTTATQAFEAVQRGDSETLLRLITTDPGVVNATNPEGVSLVSFAVYNSRRELADLLIKHGATLDIFSASACNSMNKAVEILASKPQLIHTYSPDGWTPLHLAAFFGHDLLVEFYVASGADVHAVSHNTLANTPLNAAVASNLIPVVTYLLKKGADVNFAQHGGITPLHAAAQSGNADMVQILIAYKANKDAKDDKGETPIDKATQQGHAAIVSLLRTV